MPVNLDEIRAKLTTETETVMADLGTLVDEVSKDYAQMSALPQDQAVVEVTEIVSSIIFSKVSLPWFVPQALAKQAIASAINKAIALKK